MRVEKIQKVFLRTTLAVMIMMMIAGCSTTTRIANQNSFIEPPIKPVLVIEDRNGGGICLDRENLSKLNEYIIELESIYGL